MVQTLSLSFLARRAGMAGAFVAFTLIASGARAQYTLMRGNLHSHTAYSDGGMSDPSTASPLSAAMGAQAAGLNVYSSTDHGEYLNPDIWTRTRSDAQDATQPKSNFVALFGFEWTASRDGLPLAASGLGHINVYGSSRRAGVSANPGVTGDASDWVRRIWWVNPQAAKPTQGSLFQWVLDNGVSPIDQGTIVVQINHPSSMPGVSLANPSSRVSEGDQVLVSDWWRKLEWVEPLDSYVTLMELSGRVLGGQAPQAQSPAWNEPYFQLALDNGWHLGPTNNEDNHRDSYGYEEAVTTEGARVFICTGIWAPVVTDLGTTATDRQQAQSRILSALRARRTFAAEYKASTPHKDGTSLKLTVNTVSDGVKWMGDRTLKPSDVEGSRCHLEVKPGKGLTLGKVEVISNRGVVARSLPVSGAGVTWTSGVASWDFGISGETPGAQIRACSDTVYTAPAYANLPLPPTWQGSSRGVVLNAAASGHIERYYYVRVTQVDSTGKPYYAIGSPVWIQRARKTAVSYRWDFGDGSPSQTVTVPASPAPDTVYGEVRHTYPTTGNVFYPRVTVSYSDGTSDTAMTRVVFGAAPATPFYGDASNDGQINREDIALLSRFVAGFQGVADTAQFERCNVAPAAAGGAPGATSKLDIADLLRLATFLNGRTTTWP